MAPPSLVVAHLGAPFPIGLVRWREGGLARTTFVAKLTCGFAGLPAREHAPLTALGEGETTHPGDFVPRKPGVDLLLAGSAVAARATERMEGTIAVAGARRRGVDGPRGYRRALVAIAPRPETRIPLAQGTLFEEDARTRAAPVGPDHIRVPIPPPDGGPWPHEHGFDFGVYQVASDAQQLDHLPVGGTIELGGAFVRGEAREVVVPTAPWLFVDRGFGEGDEVQLSCDTVAIDLDAATVCFVFRGELALDDAALLDVDRLLARPSPAEGKADLEAVRRGIPRARFALVQELGRVPEATDEERLRLAAFEAMEVAADPSLDVATYAAITAALAEGNPPRADVLAKHDHTEESWAIEERAQGEAMANGAWSGDMSRAAEFGEAFVAAQDALGQPEEAEWTVAQHAKLTAAIEVTTDLAATLAEHGLTNGAYLRVDRRILALVEADVAVRDAFEAELEAARADLPPLPDDEDDDDDEGEAP